MTTTLHTSDLDDFVRACDEAGGIGQAKKDPRFSDVKLVFDSLVDVTLNPFSQSYFLQQQNLYKEITGRDVQQSTNELYPIDVEFHSAGANPYADRNIPLIARHAATIMWTLVLSDAKPGAKVLDLGCGWGLTSELIAYCGGTVHAVDINPQFVQLVNRRVHRHGLPIKARVANFDELNGNECYDIILFYECLHHALRPWETLKTVTNYLLPDGKIMWAGEPVNDKWWPHWGLRLDAESLYVMRKFGWFEGGWSESFIKECFRTAGLNLRIHRSPIDGQCIGEATLALSIK